MLGGILTPSIPGEADLAYVEIISFRENEAYMDTVHQSAEKAYEDMMKIQREFTTFIARGTTQAWLSPKAPDFVKAKLMEPHRLQGAAKMGDLDIIREHSCGEYFFSFPFTIFYKQTVSYLY